MIKLYKVCKDNTSNCPFEFLCRDCFQSYKKKQYCYYCWLIYTDETNDNRSWLQCDLCSHWHHVACEENKGKFKNASKSKLKYKCPFCRDNNKQQRVKKSTNIIKKKDVVDVYSRKFNYNLKNFDSNFDLPEVHKKIPNAPSNFLSLLSNDYKGIYNDLMKINC